MDFMNNLPNMIQRHATLSAMQAHHGAAGRQLPPNLLQELATIEMRAQSALNPAQQQVAMANSQRMQQGLMQEMAADEQAQQVVRHAAVVDEGFRKVSKNMLGQENGLTKQQFELLAAGQPVPIRGNGLRYDADKMDKQIQQNTRALTKNGQGMKYGQAHKLANDLIEIRDHRGPEGYASHLKTKYGDRAVNFAQFVDQWDSSDLTEKRYIADKAIAADRYDGDRVIVPNDDDVRKATIARAWANTNENDEQDAFMLQDIDPAYTDASNDTTQGDIARIMAFAEDAEEMKEERDYRPELYDESELRDSWNQHEALENENA